MESVDLPPYGRRVAFHRFGEDAATHVLCLHGFPDEAGSLLPVARRLAAAGHGVLVPAMPGYAPSAALRSHDPVSVAAHLRAFLDAVGVGRVYVLGHDWGAVAAYALAQLDPERVVAVAALSVPPPAVFLRNLARHPAQLARSRYMAQFQLPGLSEAFVRRADLAFVETLWRRWSPGFEPPPERLDAVKAALSAPGALSAALGYYRALRDPRAWRAARQTLFARSVVPTLVLTGERDACIAPVMFEGLARAFLGPFDFACLPGAGHFLPLEATDAVADRALAFFEAHAAR